MKIIDTHCDTISCLLDDNQGLYENRLHIDMKRMKQYEQYTQFFAAFIDPVYYDAPKQRCMNIIHKLYNEIDKNNQDIILCKSASDYNHAENKIRAFLSIEGGECITDIGALEEYYELGVRCIALTWNYTNALAAGVADNAPTYGLTNFGKEVVRKMNELGIFIDVSHLHERAFWDVLNITTTPIIATHSNAKAICPHRRNLTDEQFREIVRIGGYVGLNFYPSFLSPRNEANISDIARHAIHFMELGGEHNIGFGADFDGISTLPCGICGCQDYVSVEEQFLNYGADKTVISDIEYGNFERVLYKFL